ncbi:MAG: hypothetical protein HQM08_02325 [Candidatus Riflebacteria bacterium]|nr:hypothetical protein [Candidatus Riflebacteria bacterium]
MKRCLVLLFLFFVCNTLFALDITPELLFNQMESRTDQIESMEADLEISSGSLCALVTMAIQNPDKFSIDFHDTPLRIVFDGERLWLYIGVLKEVFLLDASSSGGWVSDSIREWVNPKKIVARLTRKTLFSLFDISILNIVTETTDVATKSIDDPLASNTIKIRLSPPMDGWVKKLFDVGYYEMFFSKETFLPVLVREFSENGVCRGTLKVLEYRLNKTMPKERFIFSTPADVTEIPMGEVIRQKLYDSKDYILEGIGNMFQSLKKRISEWGF